MLLSLKHKPIKVQRVCIGELYLDPGLKEKQFAELLPDEIELLTTAQYVRKGLTKEQIESNEKKHLDDFKNDPILYPKKRKEVIDKTDFSKMKLKDKIKKVKDDLMDGKNVNLEDDEKIKVVSDEEEDFFKDDRNSPRRKRKSFHKK
jgi:hypothetical protein